MSLIFYQNGIFLKNGPLRPYSMPECRSFCNDILDGYFPFEFKDEFPEGLVFKVQDRTHALAPTSAFATVGGSATTGTPSTASGGLPPPAEGSAVSAMVAPTSFGPKEQLSAEEFLRMLPNQVVAASGQVVSIRSDIAGLMGPSKAADIRLVPTDALQLLQQNPNLAGEITTLRIKYNDNVPPMLLKLHFDDTIGTLRTHLAEQRALCGAPPHADLEIRTTFPNKTYADDTHSLRHAGLIPNALLLVRALDSE